MWARHYWAARMWAPRFWARIAEAEAPVAGYTVRVAARTRVFVVQPG